MKNLWWLLLFFCVCYCQSRFDQTISYSDSSCNDPILVNAVTPVSNCQVNNNCVSTSLGFQRQFCNTTLAANVTQFLVINRFSGVGSSSCLGSVFQTFYLRNNTCVNINGGIQRNFCSYTPTRFNLGLYFAAGCPGAPAFSVALPNLFCSSGTQYVCP